MFLIVFVIQPPHTLCESQIDVIKKSQAEFLYLSEKQKKTTTTLYELMRDRCKVTNSPGGCYELFQRLKILDKDVNIMPSDCMSAIGGIKEVKKALWESIELLVQLAWGSAPPAGHHEKFGWLDTADLTLYCSLKGTLNRVYGETRWNEFREKMMSELPKADTVDRRTVWENSILSENCARYP